MKIKIVFRGGIATECEVDKLSILKNSFGNTTGINYVTSGSGESPLYLNFDEVAGIFKVDEPKGANGCEDD